MTHRSSLDDREVCSAIITIALERADREHATPADDLVDRLLALVGPEHQKEAERIAEEAKSHISLAPLVAAQQTLRQAAAATEGEDKGDDVTFKQDGAAVEGETHAAL